MSIRQILDKPGGYCLDESYRFHEPTIAWQKTRINTQTNKKEEYYQYIKWGVGNYDELESSYKRGLLKYAHEVGRVYSRIGLTLI